MSKCVKCGVNIKSSTDICPLCRTPIEMSNTEDVFPLIKINQNKSPLVFRILKFLSMLAIIICLFINYQVSRELSWSWFVVAGITSFWLTLEVALRRQKYLLKMLFGEMVLIIIISFLWDYFTGFKFWSINYCLPFLCSCYMIAIVIMRIFARKFAKEFIFYVTINSLIGLVPGILLIFNIVDVVWPSYISVIISIVVLVFLFIFNRKQVTNELERRFHF